MNIYGKKVILRAIEKEDNEMLRAMFNDPEIENLVVGWALPLSSFTQDKWYEKHCSDADCRFVIQTEEEGAVGVITLTDIDWKNRTATNGIKLEKTTCRGKGIGTDALMALMRYAFDELGLNRLETTWFEFNMASRSLYKKCGWKEEGKKRKAVYKRGEYRDLLFGGILKDDYYDLINENHYWE